MAKRGRPRKTVHGTDGLCIGQPWPCALMTKLGWAGEKYSAALQAGVTATQPPGPQLPSPN